jgi:excisionase family DNA binding protein
MRPAAVHFISAGPLLSDDAAGCHARRAGPTARGRAVDARLRAVKSRWIYEAVRSGTLPCLRIGRHIRFTRTMLEEWQRDRAA